jgi:hypothetical protein
VVPPQGGGKRVYTSYHSEPKPQPLSNFSDTLLVGQAALKSTGRGHAHPPNQLLYLYGKEVIKSKKVL